MSKDNGLDSIPEETEQNLSEDQEISMDWSEDGLPKEFEKLNQKESDVEEEELEESIVAVDKKSLSEIRAAHEAYNNSDKSLKSYEVLQTSIHKHSYKLDKVSLKDLSEDVKAGDVVGTSVVRDSDGKEVGQLTMIKPGYKAKNAVPLLTPDDLKDFEDISITRAGLNRDGDIAYPRVTVNAIYEDGKCTNFELPPAEYGISLVNKEGKEIPEFTEWKKENKDKDATDFVKEQLESGKDISDIVVCCTKHPQGVVSLCTAQELSTNMKSMGKWQEVGHSASVGHKMEAEEEKQVNHKMEVEIEPQESKVEMQQVKTNPQESKVEGEVKKLSMTNGSHVKRCIIFFENKTQSNTITKSISKKTEKSLDNSVKGLGR